jgi:hypothetical protein
MNEEWITGDAKQLRKALAPAGWVTNEKGELLTKTYIMNSLIWDRTPNEIYHWKIVDADGRRVVVIRMES